MTRASLRAQLRGIYCIVNEGPHDPIAIATAALAAGVRIVQYRAKRGIVDAHARALRGLTREHDALYIMNDDWQAALDFDCDGVHLGPDDSGFASVAPIRAALGDRLIGLSCGTVEEARSANPRDVDYIGVGSVYATGSKADAGEPIGIDGLRRVAAATSLPVAAIGGISAARLAEVRESGVAMAAVIAAIADAAHPERAAAELVRIWSEGAA